VGDARIIFQNKDVASVTRTIQWSPNVRQIKKQTLYIVSADFIDTIRHNVYLSLL